MARAARRRQAQDALEFEQERERMLTEELEDVLAEDAGNRVDEAAFAAMEADAASLVRSMFASTPPEANDEFEDIPFDEPDPAALREEEIARLAEVLEECRRKQRALHGYLTALGDVA